MAQQLDLIRLHEVILNRFGRPDESMVKRLIERFDPHYPSRVRELNAELCQLLVYLQAPDAAAKTVALLEKAPTQEEQMHYAQVLRTLTAGWTPALRQTYFSWIARSGQYKGGNSLRGFMANIRRDAMAHLSDTDKAALKPILEYKGRHRGPGLLPRPIGRSSKNGPSMSLHPPSKPASRIVISIAAGRSLRRPSALPAIAATTRGAASAPT